MVIHIVAAAAVEHLVRRGLPANAKLLARRGLEATGEPVLPQPPAWGIALFAITCVIVMIAFFLVEYTLLLVIGTLTMIEQPTAAVTVTAVPSEAIDSLPRKDQQVPLLETGIPSITIIATKPITSKIRSTLKHLTAVAGYWSRWRGLRATVWYSVISSLVYGGFSAVLPRFVPDRPVIAATLTSLLLSRHATAVIHAVVAVPPQKSFFKRVTPWSTWKSLALPTAFNALVPFFTLHALTALGSYLGLPNDYSEGTALSPVQVNNIILFMIASLFLILFVSLPATVTLTRIQASLLPEEDESIVPFDRTFGGKVVPQILGGSGALGFVDAWRTLDWEARRRIVKLYVKTGFILAVMTIFSAVVLVGEVFVIMRHAKK